MADSVISSIVPGGVMQPLSLSTITARVNALPLQKKAMLAAAIGLGYGAYAWKKRQDAATRRVIARLAALKESTTPSDTAGDASAAKKKKRRKGGMMGKMKKLLAMVWRGSPAARRRIGVMVLLVLLRTFVSDRLAVLQGKLFSAVFLKDKDTFLTLLAQTAVLDLGYSAMQSSLEYLHGSVHLLWRRVLDEKLQAQYFSAMTYYRLSFVDKRIQNPEEIFSNDINKFTDRTSDVILDLIKGVIDGSYFTYRLAVDLGPKWALAGWLYVAFAVTVVQNLAPNYGKLLGQKQELHGGYRNAFSHMETHSEAVAAYTGDDRERQVVEERWRALWKHSYHLVNVQWTARMLQDFMYKYLGATAAAVMIVAPFFDTSRRHGAGAGNGREGYSQMLSKMRYVTSCIISQMMAIGSLAAVIIKLMRASGYAARIANLMEISDEVRAKASTKTLGDDGRPINEGKIVDGDVIAFEDIEVVTPTGHSLVKNLSFIVRPGVNMLLTGANGAGKSSLFRCLGGLWEIRKGTITKPGGARNLHFGAAKEHSASTANLQELELELELKDVKRTRDDFTGAVEDKGLCGDVFYIPQKPYNVIGSLREQITYPEKPEELQARGEDLSDERLRELLALVDLEYLLDGVAAASGGGKADKVSKGRDAVVNWEASLSIGETQRLAMARLFFHSPTFAVLDECTSGVPSAMEKRLYQLCAERGITCITISHRPALEAYHNMKLSLLGDGTGRYSLESLTGKQQSDAKLKRITSTEDVITASQGRIVASSPGTHDTPLRPVTTTLKSMEEALEEEDALPAALARSRSRSNSLASLGDAVHSEYSALKAPVFKGSTSFLGRLRRITRLLVPSWTDPSALKLMLLSAIVVGRVSLSNLIAHLNGNTVATLLQGDISAFYKLIGVSIAQSALSALLAPSLLSITSTLAVDWSRKLSKHLFDLFFHNKAYYKVIHLYPSVSHPDQRLTDDVDRLTTELADLFPEVIKPVIDVCWYTYVTQRLLGWKNTGMLYIYMVAGLGFLRLITPNFAKLTAEEQALEGTYRYVHTRVRTHAESIAFFGGGPREGDIVHDHFNALSTHIESQLRQSWSFGIVEDFVLRRLPAMVTWGLSLIYAFRMTRSERNGGDELSDTTYTSQLGHDLRYVASAVSHTFSAFAEVLQLYKRFQQLAGYTARVAQIEELLLAIKDDADASGGLCSVMPAGGLQDEKQAVPSGYHELSDAIDFDHVDLVTPDGSMLARQLTLNVKSDNNLLISGHTGAGKTSMFRILSQLWPARSGRIGRPMTPQLTLAAQQGKASEVDPVSGELLPAGSGKFAVFFVPQRPYNVLGTFADLITYPLAAADVLKQEGQAAVMERLLEVVQIPYLLVREGGWQATVPNWGDVLSLGEQQRLGMARLFFHRPQFAVLDQCTDAVSVDVEEKLYTYARRLGITILTICQRPGLLHLHTQALQLTDGRGGWQLALCNADVEAEVATAPIIAVTAPAVTGAPSFASVADPSQSSPAQARPVGKPAAHSSATFPTPVRSPVQRGKQGGRSPRKAKSPAVTPGSSPAMRPANADSSERRRSRGRRRKTPKGTSSSSAGPDEVEI